MGWVKTVLSGLLMIGASAPARAQDRYLPIEPPSFWVDIPDNRGIAAFYGDWQPTRHRYLLDVGEMYLRKGRISYKRLKDIEHYRVLHEARNYVLAFKRYNIRSPKDKDYRYHFLFIVHVDTTQNQFLSRRPDAPHDMNIYYCGIRLAWREESDEFEKRWALTDAHWRMSDEELLALWDRYEPCNPRLGKNNATAEKPWGDNWAFEPYLLMGRNNPKR